MRLMLWWNHGLISLHLGAMYLPIEPQNEVNGCKLYANGETVSFKDEQWLSMVKAMTAVLGEPKVSLYAPSCYER